MTLSAKQSRRDTGLGRSISWVFPLMAQVTIGISAIAGVILLQSIQLQKSSSAIESPQQGEQQEAIRLEALSKLPSFGFDNLIASWTFLNFIQYYGDVPARTQTGYSLSQKYFDIITRRDPRFVDSYMFMWGTISYELGQPKLTQEYLKRGTDALSPQMHPRAFSLWRWKATDEILLLGDLSNAARSMEMTANWAAESEEFKQFVPFFQQTSAWLKTNPDIRLARFQTWLSVYLEATESRTKARAKQEILALGGVEKLNDKGETGFVLPPSLLPKKSATR